MSSFSDWWGWAGRPLRPLPSEDAEKHCERVCKIAWIVARDKNESDKRLAKIAYKLARHLRNSDGIHHRQWGRMGGELLEELRRIDECRYDKEVKK